MLQYLYTAHITFVSWRFTILIERKLNQHYSNHQFYNRLSTNQIKCWFLVRGENRSTRGKTSHSRVENQQTQSTGAEIEPGPQWWKASALTTRPTLQPGLQRYNKPKNSSYKKLKFLRFVVLHLALLQRQFNVQVWLAALHEHKPRLVLCAHAPLHEQCTSATAKS